MLNIIAENTTFTMNGLNSLWNWNVFVNWPSYNPQVLSSGIEVCHKVYIILGVARLRLKVLTLPAQPVSTMHADIYGCKRVNRNVQLPARYMVVPCLSNPYSFWRLDIYARLYGNCRASQLCPANQNIWQSKYYFISKCNIFNLMSILRIEWMDFVFHVVFKSIPDQLFFKFF